MTLFITAIISALLFNLVLGQQNSNNGQHNNQNTHGNNNQQPNVHNTNDQHQFNPQGVQGMLNPIFHVGATIGHTAMELGKGFFRWPLSAMNDIQSGITGFFNSFANPMWVAPTKRPYDMTLEELLAQLPHMSSTTARSSTSKPNQNHNG